ncbi:MAG: hypothetical protein BWY26_01589 [Elusimicrobia bacterium ADurb.Bin231]|nr:MAG: hypothetical protein BWY26_01589 [Elusimicrobia bacterium ADurb.Bin231]
MKKIKNFRLELRRGYIERELRKNKQEVPAEELKTRIQEIQSVALPATVYATFSADIFKTGECVKKAEYVSIVALVLNGISDELPKDDIYRAIIKDAFDFSIDLIIKLIEIEASKEECDLSSPEEVSPENLFSVKEVCDNIKFSKIGISYSEGVLSPAMTKFFKVYWLSKRKSIKSRASK